MKNLVILTESINFIEQNLCEPITRDDIAEHCYVSLSSLEKLFRYALCMSVKTYIDKRRMTNAAKDIVKGEISITEIAMKYHYNSLEVFSRAFKRVWFINPSEFKNKRKFTDLFPRINYEYNKGENVMMARRKVDMSEAYDFLREKEGSYVICFDIQYLVGFNNISYKAGDIAILEEAARIENVASDDMIIMRIGCDEFALITGLYDGEEAKKLSDSVLSHNGETITYEDKKLPLSLWSGITKIPHSLRYAEFFSDMHEVINKSKKI